MESAAAAEYSTGEKEKRRKGNGGKRAGKKKTEEEMGKDYRPLGQGKNQRKLPLVVVSQSVQYKI